MKKKSKIYEILRQYDNRNFQIEPGDKKIHTKEEAIKQIKVLVLDLIGEDEYVGSDQDVLNGNTALARNQVRADLRDKVEAL